MTYKIIFQLVKNLMLSKTNMKMGAHIRLASLSLCVPLAPPLFLYLALICAFAGSWKNSNIRLIYISYIINSMCMHK